MSEFVYINGPTGRDLRVDDQGRLICNADASTSGFIFGYGDKGYPLLVDGAGHLLINASGISTSGVGVSESIQWTQGQETLASAGKYHATFVEFKGNIYTGAHNWFGGTSYEVYKLTPSGEHEFYSTAIAMPSGGYPWALKVIGNRLYVGAGEGGGGYLAYSEDGDTLEYALNVPGVNVVCELGEYEGKLLIGHTNNYGYNDPVFELVTDHEGNDFDTRVAFYTYADAGNWGTTLGLNTCGGRVFCTNNLGDILNVFDGVHTVGGWDTNPYTKTSPKIAKAVEFNGEIFLVGVDIFKYAESPSGGYNNGRLHKAHNMHDAVPGANAGPMAVYNNKLYVADKLANIYIYDGSTWTEYTAMSGVASQPYSLIPFDDKLYMFCWDGTYWYMRDELERNKINPSQSAKYSSTKHIQSLSAYIGAPVPNPRQTFLQNGSGIVEQPVYTSAQVVTQGYPLVSGISELDAAVYDALIPQSGLSLPGGGTYGEEFYVVGSGFYRYGMSSWEKMTIAP